MWIVIVILTLASLIGVLTLMSWADDGGPRRSPLPSPADEWSPDVPSGPYSRR